VDDLVLNFSFSLNILGLVIEVQSMLLLYCLNKQFGRLMVLNYLHLQKSLLLIMSLKLHLQFFIGSNHFP